MCLFATLWGFRANSFMASVEQAKVDRDKLIVDTTSLDGQMMV
jgi:hypothetical protein